MKKVYSHENLTILTSARNLLELDGIECAIKNEFHASGGHVGWGAVPIELWVLDDTRAEAAVAMLEKQLNPARNPDSWTCDECGEENDGSFEVCWKCQSDKLS